MKGQQQAAAEAAQPAAGAAPSTKQPAAAGASPEAAKTNGQSTVQPQAQELNMREIVRDMVEKPFFKQVLEEWALHVKTKQDGTTFLNMYREWMCDPDDHDGRKATTMFANFIAPREWEDFYDVIKDKLDKKTVAIFETDHAKVFYETFRSLLVEQIRAFWEEFGQQRAAVNAGRVAAGTEVAKKTVSRPLEGLPDRDGPRLRGLLEVCPDLSGAKARRGEADVPAGHLRRDPLRNRPHGPVRQEAANDPVVRRQALEIQDSYGRMVRDYASMNGARLGDQDERAIKLQAIDDWCRDHFVYVNDPPNIEVIQTPRRMVKQTRVPARVLEFLMTPFYDAFRAAGYDVKSYVPKSSYIGDCDEAVVGMQGLAVCTFPELDMSMNGPGAQPSRYFFQFGGNGGTLHHVWSKTILGGVEYHADHTEPGYKLGKHSDFEAYEDVEIEL